jgi:hypothetical protein
MASKNTPSKKTPAKKTSAKKQPAKKAAAKKPPVKKAAAKKTPAKKQAAKNVVADTGPRSNISPAQFEQLTGGRVDRPDEPQVEVFVLPKQSVAPKASVFQRALGKVLDWLT